jgi:hypothetical protein
MAKETVIWRRQTWTLLWSGVLLALVGCGGPKRYPVSGQVTLSGSPITTGRVFFSPDVDKGNTARVACVGRIDDKGRYELHTTGITNTESGKGAPPGWYKVTIRPQGSKELDPRIKGVYLNEGNTPLSIEVVAKPADGAYDLKLEP